jgi:hypothetical protein
MNSNHKTSTVTSVTALERRLRRCRGSKEYVAVIRALVVTRDPAAIVVLASLLDSTGPIATESIAGLLTFGEAVIPAMRKCVDSLDYDMIRHGHFVLAALGDHASKQWLREDDVDRVEAYLERKGFVDVECGDRIANETDEEEGIA